MAKKRGRKCIDLTGLQFGFLSVIKIDKIKSSKVTKKHMQNSYWICFCNLCRCNTSIRSDYLRNGVSRQCRDCTIDMKIRLMNSIREVKRKEAKARLRIFKRNNRSNNGIFVIKPTIRDKVKPLRVCGTSIADIAELLDVSTEEVMTEILRYRDQNTLE